MDRKIGRMCLFHALFFLMQSQDSSSAGIKKMEVQFDDVEAIHVINQFSPSVAVGMGLFSYNWIQYLANPKLMTLVKALGPSYIRMGGTKSDHCHFVGDSIHARTAQTNIPATDDHCNGRMLTAQELEQHLANVDRENILEGRLRHHPLDYSSINISYTASDFDDFMNFVSCTGLKLIFGLNLLDRNGQTWDPVNTKTLLEYAKSKGYRIDWELGNEPNSFMHSAGISLSAKQVADGFVQLKDFLKSDKWWRESMLYGPDSNNMFKRKSRKFLRTFLRRAKGVINSATFHHYYINSVNATVENFTDYKILNHLNNLIDSVVKVIRKQSSELPIWIGETGSSYGGGADGLSNRYVAGFMWLDKLGICASNGVELVFRQTLIEGNYSLIDKYFDPNPDYWLTLIYKTLVGRQVLNTTVSSARNSTKFRNSGKFRVYAHCTNTGRTSYGNGAVTLYYLNLLSKERVISVNAAAGRSKPKVAMKYILTSAPGNLTSKDVYLNGEKLQMIDARTMPILKPVSIDLATEEISVPAKSFGFVVLPDVQAAACLSS